MSDEQTTQFREYRKQQHARTGAASDAAIMHHMQRAETLGLLLMCMAFETVCERDATVGATLLARVLADGSENRQPANR
ncbi:MAG: hypothetical protein Kow00120_06380 [Anaerolineae bacterium]